MQSFFLANEAIFRALHIIFMVSWFAGLFYIIRLFIYHTEAGMKPETEKRILQEQFSIMEWRLWYIITTPAMILTILFGTCLLIAKPFLLSQPWMQIKLTFVGLLLIYHFISQGIMNRLKNGGSRWTSMHLRLWNELATLILVAVVFLVITKGTLSWIAGMAGFFGTGIALMIGIRVYKKLRKD